MDRISSFAVRRPRRLGQLAAPRVLWLAWFLVSGFLLLLPTLLKLDGRAHGDWQQFFGRFHPIVVHLPIGLILLVPVLEVGGRFRPALREAAGFALALSGFACLASVAFGYLLAYGSGTIGAVLTRHMWGAILLTIATMAGALARPALLASRSIWMYPAGLSGILLLMMWSTHQGGSLTHGSNYLTEYLPPSIKNWSPLQTAHANTSSSPPTSFYMRHIHPVLDSNCVGCHSEAKTKGGLRLDSYDLLMRGGKEGAVVIAGSPDRSILFQRITLPVTDKHFMPTDGKPALKPEQISWIKAWIAQGASPVAETLTGIQVLEEANSPAAAPVPDYSRLTAQILELERSEGIRIRQVSKAPGDGLLLNTIDAGPSFTDAQLAKLQPLAPYIVEAELGRTGITDSSFETLKSFVHLRALHLEGTAVTGAGIASLAQLPELSYLNLSETQVSAAAVLPLRSLKTLRHLYLYNTPAEPVAGTASLPATPTAGARIRPVK